jgi:2-keto-3-deoxy-6-phosphogluconate aldolase
MRTFSKRIQSPATAASFCVRRGLEKDEYAEWRRARAFGLSRDG